MKPKTSVSLLSGLLASALVSGCRCSSPVSPTGPVVSLSGGLSPGQARAYDVAVPSDTTRLKLHFQRSAVGLELMQVDVGCAVEAVDSCDRLLRVGPPEAPVGYGSIGRVTGATARFIVRNTLATLAITFSLSVEPVKGSGCSG
jgi:hypothetical protein